VQSSRVKKILIWEALNFLGGGQRISLQVGRFLRQSGRYEVVFLLPGRGPFSLALEKEGFEYRLLSVADYSLGKKKFTDYLRFIVNTWVFLRHFSKVVGRNEFDIIYTGGTRVLIWSTLVGKILGLPVIWHIHNIFEDSRVRSVLEWFGKSATVRQIICVSRCVSDQFPALKCKTSVLFNSVNLRHIEVQGIAVKGQAGPVVISIGNLQPVKRIEDLIAATSMLVKKIPDIQVFIAGGDRNESQAYSVSLKKMVADVGLENQILFLGHRDDIPELLAQADICVGMGREACPLFVLESFSAGTPVVGPNISGTKELLDIAGGGLLYPYGDAEQLCAAMIRLLEDVHLRERLSAEAKRFASECCMENFSNAILYRFDTIHERGFP